LLVYLFAIHWLAKLTATFNRQNPCRLNRHPDGIHQITVVSHHLCTLFFRIRVRLSFASHKLYVKGLLLNRLEVGPLQPVNPWLVLQVVF